MKDFRELKVWEKAHSLTLAIYKATTFEVTEVKRMLTSFIKKLKADS